MSNSTRSACNVTPRCSDANPLSAKEILKIIVYAIVSALGFFFFAWIVVLIPAWYVADPNSYLLVDGIIAIIIFAGILVIGILMLRRNK